MRLLTFDTHLPNPPASSERSGISRFAIANAKCHCLSFILIGFFICLAENIITFFGIWKCPHQIGTWSTEHIGKWSSCSLLGVMRFTIVSNLEHIKQRVQVPA